MAEETRTLVKIGEMVRVIVAVDAFFNLLIHENRDR